MKIICRGFIFNGSNFYTVSLNVFSYRKFQENYFDSSIVTVTTYIIVLGNVFWGGGASREDHSINKG